MTYFCLNGGENRIKHIFFSYDIGLRYLFTEFLIPSFI